MSCFWGQLLHNGRVLARLLLWVGRDGYVLLLKLKGSSSSVSKKRNKMLNVNDEALNAVVSIFFFYLFGDILAKA